MPVAGLALALGAAAFVASVAQAQVHATAFTSGGVELKAYYHRSAAGSHRATVVFLHGNPGGALTEQSVIADSLTSHGADVFRFNYRGLWGNSGDFNLSNSLADVTAALDYLTSPQAVERFGIDTSRIVLVGDSFGTATGLLTARDDKRVDAVAALVPCDHGWFGKQSADPDSPIRGFLDSARVALFGKDGPIKQDAAIFFDDLEDNSVEFSFLTRPEGLMDDDLLFLVGLDDQVCYPDAHFFPLYRTLRVMGHPGLEASVLDMDHDFNDLGWGPLLAMVGQWLVETSP